MRARAAAGAAVLVAALLAGSVPVHADHGASWFPNRWRSTPVLWYFRSDFPTGPFRARVADGWGGWNVHNQSVKFAQGGFDIGYYDNRWSPCSLPQNRNGIWWEELGSRNGEEIAGQTTWCGTADGGIWAATVAFDTTTSWYTASATGDAPASTMDLRSVATHEFGHAFSFSLHWDDAATICANNSGHHTMCRLIWPGTERDRTTEVHEETAFFAAY